MSFKDTETRVVGGITSIVVNGKITKDINEEELKGLKPEEQLSVVKDVFSQNLSNLVLASKDGFEELYPAGSIDGFGPTKEGIFWYEREGKLLDGKFHHNARGAYHDWDPVYYTFDEVESLKDLCEEYKMYSQLKEKVARRQMGIMQRLKAIFNKRNPQLVSGEKSIENLQEALQNGQGTDEAKQFFFKVAREMGVDIAEKGKDFRQEMKVEDYSADKALEDWKENSSEQDRKEKEQEGK